MIYYTNTMFECKKAIYDEYYIVFNEIYNGTDDIIIIDNKTYTITGITDIYNVHLLDMQTLHLHKHKVYSAGEFVNILQNSNVVYKYNRYNECKKRNINYCRV